MSELNFSTRLAKAEQLFEEKHHIDMTLEQSGAFSGGFRIGYDDCIKGCEEMLKDYMEHGENYLERQILTNLIEFLKMRKQ